MLVASTAVTVAAICLALVKVRIIMREFMEVRHAPPLLRRLTDLWIGLSWPSRCSAPTSSERLPRELGRGFAMAPSVDTRTWGPQSRAGLSEHRPVVVLVVLGLLSVALLAPRLGLPATVPPLTIHNPTAYTVFVEASGPSGQEWTPVAVVSAHHSEIETDLVDEGPVWNLRFTSQGGRGGRLPGDPGGAGRRPLVLHGACRCRDPVRGRRRAAQRMIEVRPATPDRWDDVVSAFGRRGADPSWCWCQRFLGTRDQTGPTPTNREALRAEVAAAAVAPGLIAYVDDRPVGWSRVGPRSGFPALGLNRALARVFDAEETGVWWVTCFAVDSRYRRAGVGAALLAAAVDFARTHGAVAVEGHPVDVDGLRADQVGGSAVFAGTLAMFAAAGFTEVARTSATRPVMRLSLSDTSVSH